MLLGAIADDLTGATDLALTLSRRGMRTLQTIGVPPDNFDFGEADAVVVALKSRTVPAELAVRESLDAARALNAAGARQLLFKYCSTFDSTPAGNIGPVTEALLDFVGERFTIACPSLPVNGRTVYKGHLFVGDSLLSDSPMKDHPLTPMTDSNIVRVLQQQTDLKVGLIDHRVVSAGAEAVDEAFASAAAQGIRIAVIDAVSESDLRTIGRAGGTLKLITGGSGIGIGLPRNFGFAPQSEAGQSGYAAPVGRSVIVAGSCSAATRRQVAMAIEAGFPAMKIDALAVAEGSVNAHQIADWVRSQDERTTPLVYSSADPGDVKRAQERLGREHAGAVVEEILAATAVRLERDGFSRFLVAGGETSGAVVAGLNVPAVEIGPEIDPGVPWTRSRGRERPVVLALKSGNFGADDFFLKAWSLLA